MDDDGRYFHTIDEEYIRSLPVKSFEGTIYLIDTPEKLVSLKHMLIREKLFGFDTETKPSFRKGRINHVAMLQLATPDKAFLIRLKKTRLPDFMIHIFENPGCLKVGVAIKDDLKSLIRLRPFQPDGFIELQDFVERYGIVDNGLKKLVANVLGFRISKKHQTSNWERTILTEDQLKYAATDAWVCLKIYSQLINSER